MWNRKRIGAALILGLIAGTVWSGDASHRAVGPSTCTPTLSGAPATVFDGNLATFWQTPGLIQQQAVTIDLGCQARVFRFRRYMTCDGTATSGSACRVINEDGRRHLGFDDVWFSNDAGASYQSATSIGATGWEAYRVPRGFDALPYGWTPWLDLKGVSARFLRFYFVDAADALNEIEIEYAEGGGTTAGVSPAEVISLTEKPLGITVGPDRALWITARSESSSDHKIYRLTTQGDLSQYSLPQGVAPFAITTGPDSALWFTTNTASFVGQIRRLTLSNDLTTYPIPSTSNSGGITAGPDGNLWFSESARDFVGRVTPSGVFSEFAAGVGNGITAGPDSVWFTITGPSDGTGFIGRALSNGLVLQFPGPKSPKEIAFGSDGALWFTHFFDPRIGKMTAAGAFSYFPLPKSTKANPIKVGPDGNVWFGSTGRIGRVTPDGTITEFDLPDAGEEVNDLTTGPDGAIWYVHGSPNGVGRIALVQGPDLRVGLTTTETSVEAAGGEAIVYDGTMSNHGNQDASGVVVNLQVPTRTRFDAAESSPGWTCSPDNEAGSFCTLAVGALLPGGPEAAFKFAVRFTGASGVSGSNLYTRATIADDRSHGPDLSLADNDSSMTIPEVAAPPCGTSENYLRCCVVEMIDCFFNPGECGGSPSTPGGASRRAASAPGSKPTLIERVQTTVRRLDLYYRMRDEVFERTPGGRRLNGLYYQHSSEIKGLLLTDPALREDAWNTLNAWAPTLQDVVEHRPGTAISAGQVSRMTGFLTALAAKASPALRQAIESERRGLGIDAFGGLLPSAALQRLDHFTCTPGDTTLCLNGGRFRVESTWADFAGNTGVGHAVPMTSDTGSFWFFSPANIELTTKALDGRGVNGHYWFFYGALSNVAYSITVTDTATGAAKTYSNPSGRFGSAGDAAAFPGGSSTTIRSPLERSPEAYRFSAAACTANSTSLCLNGGRFRVEVSWRDFQGNTGAGHAVPLTADTGTFWFFSSANVELVVKALDGRGFNNRYWLFYGALSNVEYTLTVTDTVTGAVQTYTNPSGTFASVGDTSAFVP